MKRPRIYLAGPDLFYPDADQRYARLKAICAERGLDGVAPTDGQHFPIEPTTDGARRLRRHDLATLQSCDAVLANITPFNGLEPDSGTAYEMGFAAACGMPVAAYCLDGQDTHLRALRAGRLIDTDGRDDEGLLVENFGLAANLMLCAAHATFFNPDGSAEHLVATLAVSTPQAAPREQLHSQCEDLAVIDKAGRSLRAVETTQGARIAP